MQSILGTNALAIQIGGVHQDCFIFGHIYCRSLFPKNDCIASLWKWVGGILVLQNVGPHEFYLHCLDERLDLELGFRLRLDAGLRLVVKRAIEAAVVEVDSHFDAPDVCRLCSRWGDFFAGGDGPDRDYQTECGGEEVGGGAFVAGVDPDVGVEGAGEEWADAAGEGGHALEGAEDFALFFGGGVAGDEGLDGGVEEGGAEGEECGAEDEAGPGGEDDSGEADDGESDGDEERSDDGECGFAEGLGESADHTALDEGDDDADAAEEVAAVTGGVLSGEFGAVLDDEGEGLFHAGEGEAVDEGHEDEHADDGASELVEDGGGVVAAEAFGVRVAGVVGFGEGEEGEGERGGGEESGGDGDPVKAEVFANDAADERTEDEADAEGGADEAHSFGAFFGFSDVGDVGGGDGDVAAGDAVEDAGEVEEEDGEIGVEGDDEVGGEEEEESDEGAELGNDEYRSSAGAVGPFAEDGGEDELEDGVGGTDEGEEEDVVDSEGFAVVLLVGEEDAEADEVDEDDEEDGEEGGFFHARWVHFCKVQ